MDVLSSYTHATTHAKLRLSIALPDETVYGFRSTSLQLQASVYHALNSSEEGARKRDSAKSVHQPVIIVSVSIRLAFVHFTQAPVSTICH